MAIDFIDQQTLEKLLNYRDDVCVSIYLPMVQKGADVKGNPVKLENRLKELRTDLKERGLQKAQIDDLLEGSQALLSDPLYWQEQHEGLALFLAPGFFDAFRLPMPFEPLTTVSERFHIKPILALFSGDGQYYVLALNQDNVRLFQATHHSIEELEAEQIPVSMDEALAYEDPEEQLQHHTTTAGGPGGAPESVHHGHSMDDEQRQRLRRFLKAVANGVEETVQGDDVPLVLAAVDFLHPMFAEAYGGSNLVAQGIEGSPDDIDVRALHRQAWEIVAPLFKEAQEEASSTFDSLKHTDQALDDIRALVPAAFQGRVDTLFVALNEYKWGRYDIERNEVQLHESTQQNGDDLLDFAAVQTLANGGEVYVVDSSDVPGKTTIAGILRF